MKWLARQVDESPEWVKAVIMLNIYLTLFNIGVRVFHWLVTHIVGGLQ